MTEQSVLYSKYGVDLILDEQGRHVLAVLVGTIAMYEIRIALTGEEIEEYGSWGHHFVERLALKIMERPEAYRTRHLGKES
ncbi:MAG: hypothetical protein KKB20_22505 [Proteobacteria bacterium]|nr:hypothetical protein [Pseudomonadota bacterium]